MKIVRYEYRETTGYGTLQGEEILPLQGTLPNFEIVPGASPVQLSDARLLMPCEPSKIVAVGPNHKGHFRDGRVPPPRTHLWIKPTTSFLDPEGVVMLPKRPKSVAHEAEIGIVIGRKATRVSPEEAMDYVFGYTCVLDVTASIGQPDFLGSQDMIDGKTFDTFGPFGPHIETELDPNNLRLQCRVNGVVKQDDSTSRMIWMPAELISQVSYGMTLLPGDIIACGTVPGYSPIRDGDVVEVEVEGIGVLRVSCKNVV